MAEGEGPDGCGKALATALAAIGLLIGWFCWGMYQGTHPTPPDVAAFARSAAMRQADQAAATAAEAQVSAFRKGTPWATYMGASTTDLCLSQIRSAAITFHDAWSPISCQRSTTVYLAFDGDFVQRLRQLDMLTQQSLRWGAQPLGGRTSLGPLVGALVYGQQPPLGTTAVASPHPAEVTMRYTLSVGSGSDGAPTLEVSVAPKPEEPETSYADNFADMDGSSKRPYDDDSTDRVVYLAWRPVTPKVLAATAYQAHAFMLALTVSSRYTDQSASPTHTPPALAPTSNYSPCYSGSGTCG